MRVAFNYLFRRSGLITALFLLALFSGLTESVSAFQLKTPDVDQLRRSLIANLGEDFEFIKGEINYHVENSEKQSYWLAHVKPKKTGLFTIKYTYNYADKFYASGETEMRIGIGASGCTRYPQVVRDIAHFCLGDTLIIPVRLHSYSNHIFSLKSEYLKPENLAEMREQTDFYLNRLNKETVANPLDSNLKYLGMYQTDNLYRSGGGEFTNHAVFEAKSTGRFNLELSLNSEDSNQKPPERRSIPIIIINRGTPITAPIPLEKATYYIKDRTYSSHYFTNFASTLLILQPGEVISISYSFFIERPFWQRKDDQLDRDVKNRNPKPFIHKQSFMLEKGAGFNDWIADYLP